MAQSSFTARVFAIAAASCLAWASWHVLREVAVPALWATFGAVLLWPMNLRARQLVGGRPGTAAALLTVGGAIGLAAPAVLIGVEFIHEASKLGQRLGAILRNAPTSSAELRAHWETGIVRRLQQALPIELDLDVEHIRERVVATLGSGLQFLVSHLGNAFVGALGAASGLALSLFVLFFALRDGERIIDTTVSMIPLEATQKQVLLDHLGVVTRALVLGTLATAGAQGALVAIAFAAVGLPAPIVLGVIAGILSVFPLGTSIVWVPAAVALAVLHRFVGACFMMLWGILVVSSIDNFIRPRIVSKRGHVPTLIVFLGIIGGIANFGLIGVLVGPLVLVTTFETARLLLAPSSVA